MHDKSAFTLMVASRIRLARESSKISQQDLADKLGLDLQTISAIETGERALSSKELIGISNTLDTPLSFFVDPYIVTEKYPFSFIVRSPSVDTAAFERSAHNLISADLRFMKLIGFQTDTPRINVLFIDGPDGITGATCHIPDGDYIVVNRKDIGRYDLIRKYKDKPEETGDMPLLYNAEFVQRLHAVLTHGLVSVGKAASVLECSRNDIYDLTEAYGLEVSF